MHTEYGQQCDVVSKDKGIVSGKVLGPRLGPQSSIILDKHLKKMKLEQMHRKAMKIKS